ncbi:MAG: MarR family winged helix-turn-helix transcriptional regulator [Persicimonas sp.]
MPTHYEGSEQERRALDTYIKFVRAAESILAHLSGELAERDLTLSQFGTLELIYHLGPLCQKTIGEKLLKSGGNITMVVNNLEARGLVTRKRRESDRRFVSVELTGAGRELIEEVLPEHVDAIVDIFSVLSAEEQETLASLCKRVGLRLTDEESQ